MLPDLSGLSLLLRGADVGATVPESSVTDEVKDGKLPRDVFTARGFIASAGAKKGDTRKKELLRKIANQYGAKAIWTGKRQWLYAYWNTDNNLAALVLDLQLGSIAYRLLGNAQIKPNEYVVANIHKHWTESPHWDGRRPSPPDPDTASARFLSDTDGTVTRGLFEKISSQPGMTHWQDFKTVEDVLALVRAGEPLPMMWMDDGMQFIDEYLQKLNRR